MNKPESNNKKVYVIGDADYANWLRPIEFEITNNIESADLLFFTGGSDVNPEYYGDLKGEHTYCDRHRDSIESDIYHKFEYKMKIGVCRGGQFLTVMNGYKLVQHSSHPSWHNISTFDGKTLLASSTHHQQFLLQKNRQFNANPFKLIAWAENLSAMHLNGKNIDYNFPADYQEPEIVLYSHRNDHNINSLAIQMHPEFFMSGEPNHPTIKYLQQLVLDTLIDCW